MRATSDSIVCDYLVIGAGVAGLRAAISLSTSGKVLVLAKDTLHESASEYAQGGIAAALSDDDEVTLHEQDTLAAGDGLCDADAVKTLVNEGPHVIEELLAWGAEFDREGGELVFGREGAHSRNRILHAHGDSTGREISRARTFGFLRDVEHLWKAGFALGSSLDNTVALDDERVLNPEGLRFADEFVRHKTLDAIGDLSLAGAPILGAYRSYCGGHKMNSAVLDALFADPSAYEFVEAPRQTVGGGRTDIRVAASPAFAADRS